MVPAANPEPKLRAAHVQDNLEALSLFDGDRQRAVRASLSNDMLTAVRGATRVDWVPIRYDIELIEAISRVSGVDGLREWSREAFVLAVHSPLLRPLLTAAVSLFGVTPRGLYRWADKAWTRLYRHCGHLRATGDAPSMLVVWDDVPASIAQSKDYVVAIAGALDAVPSLCGTTGRVDIAQADDPKTIVFECRWTGHGG